MNWVSQAKEDNILVHTCIISVQIESQLNLEDDPNKENKLTLCLYFGIFWAPFPLQIVTSDIIVYFWSYLLTLEKKACSVTGSLGIPRD